MNDILIRLLTRDDALTLTSFYNGLSEESLRTFRPLGAQATEEKCRALIEANLAGTKLDLLAVREDSIVGWGFIWNLDQPEPMFGLAVADRVQGQGIGPWLAAQVLLHARERNIPRVVLTVVKDNERARRIYEKLGFTTYGEFRHDEDGQDYYRMELKDRKPH